MHRINIYCRCVHMDSVLKFRRRFVEVGLDRIQARGVKYKIRVCQELRAR
jgi:hypothetical protein